MNMKITQDVITDLLPLYQSGEASADTNELVRAYLLENPGFAQIANARPEALLGQPQPVLPQEAEMQTLNKTRNLLWQRSLFLGFAIFFSAFAFSFRFDNRSVSWIWSDIPIAGGICMAVGIFFWARYAHTARKLKGAGL